MLLIFRYSRILYKLTLMADENRQKILWPWEANSRFCSTCSGGFPQCPGVLASVYCYAMVTNNPKISGWGSRAVPILNMSLLWQKGGRGEWQCNQEMGAHKKKKIQLKCCLQYPHSTGQSKWQRQVRCQRSEKNTSHIRVDSIERSDEYFKQWIYLHHLMNVPAAQKAE